VPGRGVLARESASVEGVELKASGWLTIEAEPMLVRLAALPPKMLAS
jgi:hypothetical protein